MCHLRVWTWELDSAVSEQSVGEHVRKHFIGTLGMCLVLITSQGMCRVQKDRQAVLDRVKVCLSLSRLKKPSAKING